MHGIVLPSLHTRETTGNGGIPPSREDAVLTSEVMKHGNIAEILRNTHTMVVNIVIEQQQSRIFDVHCQLTVTWNFF